MCLSVWDMYAREVLFYYSGVSCTFILPNLYTLELAHEFFFICSTLCCYLIWWKSIEIASLFQTTSSISHFFNSLVTCYYFIHVCIFYETFPHNLLMSYMMMMMLQKIACWMFIYEGIMQIVTEKHHMGEINEIGSGLSLFHWMYLFR